MNEFAIDPYGLSGPDLNLFKRLAGGIEQITVVVYGIRPTVPAG